jgi:3-oxoacyl-[acyl-carrier protein] reductase
MDLGLKGRVALVPASSKGIGYGVARVLAAEGCKVSISSRNSSSISKARQRLVEETGNKEIFSMKADLNIKEDIAELVRSTNKELGRVDILGYNTGPPKPGTFSELSEDDWNTGISLLLTSAVRLAKAVIPGMLENKFGRLIFITSTTLRQPVPNLVLSNTIRLSLAGLSKSLALEYGPRGITSNGIMQGHILTDRQREIATDTAKRSGKSIEESMKLALSDVPLARYGTPEEVGSLTAFLASSHGSYINGAMIAIDGGMIRSVF